MKIEHVALWVRDLERMKDFYVHTFDGQAGNLYHNPKKNFRSYFIKFKSGARLELMNIGDRPQNGLCDCNHCNMHSMHIAFSLGSNTKVDELTSTLKDQGYRIISAPRLTGDGYYESCILDPEGNVLELTS